MNRRILMLAVLLVPTIALAQQAMSPELAAKVEAMREKSDARFKETDRNRDGKLDFAEWQQARNQKLAERFRAMDSDKDGKLTQQEMQESRQEHRTQRRERRKQGD